MSAVIVQGMGNPVTAEVASDDWSKSRGLSGHAPLAADQGMWFPYAAPQDVGFWMSNLTFGIDIIFCRSMREGAYEVRKIARNCRPRDLDEITAYDVDGVLEVAAGRAAMLEVGDVLEVADSFAAAAMLGSGSEPDNSEEIQEKIDLERPANDPLTIGLARRIAQDQQATTRRFLVEFDTSATWSQVRQVIAKAATEKARSGPEADPADRVRSLYEVRIAAAGSPGAAVLSADPTVRERLGRIARKHLDNARFRLEFTEPAGRARDGGDLPPHAWSEEFVSAFEGIRDIDATGVIVSVRLA